MCHFRASDRRKKRKLQSVNPDLK
uniref:Uncharacterized protein n=1 Tax=Anguilla anguilla TaxID=7936 RepID=A0A0E9VXY7_ANGAN